jgi:hypothetical protein
MLNMSGSVTLSVELELGWGMHDIGEYSHLSEDRSREETALSRLLRACRTHDIPISFDVVGHLFHNSCGGHHDGPYPNSWWDADPGSSEAKQPLFYAPEMVREIIDDPIDHEICTHTYSHVLAEEMADEVLRHELQEVRKIHEAWELPPPKSIVMPRHQEVSYRLLSNHGIETIRRPIPNYEPRGMNPMEKLWWLLTRDHPPCEITRTDGLVETTCTPHPSLANLILPTGPKPTAPQYRPVPGRVREWLHKRYLKNAISLAAEQDCHIHLWTHLHNMANDPQWRALEPALASLGRAQSRDAVSCQRMCDLPAMIE